MPADQLAPVMVASATEILETMFFISPEQTAAPEHWDAQNTGALVEFEGERNGRFKLHLEQSLLQEMTAGFLGEMDPGAIQPAQASQVARELANMLCGVTLSRLAPKEIFSLSSPADCKDIPADLPESSSETVTWLDSGQGLIRLALAWKTKQKAD